MIVVSGIILSVYLLYIMINKRKEVLEPEVLFGIVIGITFFITTFRLSDIQEEYDIWFIIMIILLISIFYLGCSFANKLRIKNIEKDDSYINKSMRISIFFLWILVLVSFVVMVMVLGPPPAISKVIRANYFLSGWGTLVLLQFDLMALLLYDHYSQRAVNCFWFYLIQSTLVLIAVLLSNKTQLIYMMFLWIVAENSYRKKISFKTFIYLAIIVVLIFILFNKFIYEQMYGITLEQIKYGYHVNLPHCLEILTQPYLYIECNFDNLYRFLKNNEIYLWGYKTFEAFIELFGLKSFLFPQIVDSLENWENLLKTKTLTTGTLFSSFAQDGGIPMMFIMTFICGCWSKYCTRRFALNKSFLNYYLYSSVIAAIFLSFFTNYFTDKVVVVNVIVAALVAVFIRIKIVYKR